MSTATPPLPQMPYGCTGTTLHSYLNAYIPLKHWYPPTRLHGVITQKTVICEDMKWFYLSVCFSFRIY